MRLPEHFVSQLVQCDISHQKRAFFFCFAHLFHQVGAQRENRARAHNRTVRYGAQFRVCLKVTPSAHTHHEPISVQGLFIEVLDLFMKLLFKKVGIVMKIQTSNKLFQQIE